MFRRLAACALSALLGCSFTGGSSLAPDAGGDGDGDGDGGGDGDGDAGADAPIDGPLELALCDPANGSIGACWEFENNLDDSARDNDGTGVNNPTFAVAGFDGSALSLDGVDQAVTVDESSDLDASAITIEARIRPAALPGNDQERVVIDNQGQWALALFDNQVRLRCTGAGGDPSSIESAADIISVDEWIHVACTIDDQRTRLFLDGDEVACGLRDEGARTSGTVGTAIGADLDGGGAPNDAFFEGLIDSLRVFEEARTPAQICAAAGRTDCAEITDTNNCEDGS